MLTLWLYIQSIPKLILIRRLRCFAHRFQGLDEGVRQGRRATEICMRSYRCLSDYLLSLLYVSELFFLHTYAPLHASWPLARSPKPDSWWGVQSNFLRPFLFYIPGEASDWSICIHHGMIESKSWENLTLLKGWLDQKKIIWWETVKCRLISCS